MRDLTANNRESHFPYAVLLTSSFHSSVAFLRSALSAPRGRNASVENAGKPASRVFFCLFRYILLFEVKVVCVDKPFPVEFAFLPKVHQNTHLNSGSFQIVDQLCIINFSQSGDRF